jgi:hypothetical protein
MFIGTYPEKDKVCGNLEAFDGTAETFASVYAVSAPPSLMPLWERASVLDRPWNNMVAMSTMIERNVSLSLTDWRSRYESPPLTEQELRDIHIGIEEVRSGKAKHFTSLGETLEWLHRKRTK